MKIVITSTGNTLDSPIDPRFGRCPFFVLVDSETTEFQAVENQAMMTPGGAGIHIQAAQFVADSGAEAVITGNVGPIMPPPPSPLRGSGVLTGATRTVGEMLTTFRNGQLQDVTNAMVAAHYGMAGGMGRGMGCGVVWT